MTAPICQREIVTVYTNYICEDETDIYVVFKSGIVMYCDETSEVTRALNASYYWRPSSYGERHVRDLFEFIGYFPAPCKELI